MGILDALRCLMGADNFEFYLIYILLSTYIFVILGDPKVTQPILKYLLMVAIQYSSIGLINTQYRCDYTRVAVGHVML
jgi:hypothetical protein